MAQDSSNLNMVELLKAGLEKEVKRALTEQLVKEELVSYEEKLRAKIKPTVERISFKSIDRVKDLLKMRDELHIFLKWDGDKEAE